MKLILFSICLYLLCISLPGCMTDTVIRWWNDGTPMSDKKSNAYSLCQKDNKMITKLDYDLFYKCLKDKGY